MLPMSSRTRSIAGKPEKCFVVKTIRLTAGELTMIDRACRAVSRSVLMSEALVDAGHRLGIYVGSARAAPQEAGFYVPQRSVSCGSRVSISLSRTAAAILAAAAKQVGTSEPRFLVGATLAYIARLEAAGELVELPPQQRRRSQ